MSVHGGGKIAGHSGTDFKHRTGFAARKANLRHRQRIGKAIIKNKEEISLQKSPIIKTSNRFQTHPLERLLKISLAFITVALIVTVFVFTQRYGYFVDPTYYSKPEKPIAIREYNQIQEQIAIHAFHTNLKEASLYVGANRLDEAQSMLVRALKIYPRDAKANFLMTELLVKRCVMEKESYEEAATYLKSMQQLEGVDRIELKYLQRMYNHKMEDSEKIL